MGEKKYIKEGDKVYSVNEEIIIKDEIARLTSLKDRIIKEKDEMIAKITNDNKEEVEVIEKEIHNLQSLTKKWYEF